MADPVVDAKYQSMRKRFGGDNGAGNGYLANWFFLREQAYLTPQIRPGDVLDIACGSGLMLKSLSDEHRVTGIDFNDDACVQAKINQVTIIRGDAFCLPFDNESFDAVVNCQFFNQQPSEQIAQFFSEASRILKPGGEIHILWRGGETLVHRLAHGIFSLKNRLSGVPIFPQFLHTPKQLRDMTESYHLAVREQRMTLPLGPTDINTDSLLAKCLGASYYMQFEKVS